MSDSQGAIHLTTDSFQAALDSAAKDGHPVFVDFYADWCGPCQVAAPIVDSLADEYKGKAVIAKVNVDENNDLSGEHGVMSIPTVVIFKNGEEVDRKIGFPGEDGYRSMLDDAIAGE